MEHSKQSPLEETLNYIFKMNEKEVFMNEIQNLVEDIENNGIQNCRIPILVNFILYKLSELESHQKIAETLLNHYKSNGVKNSMEKYCQKESFRSIKQTIIDVLLTKILDLDGIPFELVKKMIIPESNSKITSSQLKLLKLIENKYKERERGGATSAVVANISNVMNTPQVNCTNGQKNINNSNNFNYSNINIYNNSANNLNNESKLNSNNELSTDNLFNLNMMEDLFSLPQEEEVMTSSKRGVGASQIPSDNQKNNINSTNATPRLGCTYKLRIYYLDGSDSYFQLINVKSKNHLDYNSFIFNLKKKLGIYENSKFKIIILENKKEKEFFTDMSQLKLEEVNEMKIVPVHYLLDSANLY